jgi:RNA pseudouridylate synthase
MQALGMATELLPLHRLDCGTEGIVVMGKNAAFAKRFGKLMRNSSSADAEKASFRKTYLALSTAPAPVGLLRHHALINVRVKGLPASTRLVPRPCKESVVCVLEVLEVRFAL